VANFNLADYETVDSRIKRFYGDNPNGRISTELIAYEGAVGATRWIVKAHVFRDREHPEPDGTGYAFEVDGSGMANKTSALENGETSAIGRALANIGYSGDKRASREEMAKAAGANAQTVASVDAVVANEWIETLEAATSVAQLQAAWEGAGAAGVTREPKVIAAKDKKKAALSANT